MEDCCNLERESENSKKKTRKTNFCLYFSNERQQEHYFLPVCYPHIVCKLEQRKLPPNSFSSEISWWGVLPRRGVLPHPTLCGSRFLHIISIRLHEFFYSTHDSSCFQKYWFRLDSWLKRLPKMSILIQLTTQAKRLRFWVDSWFDSSCTHVCTEWLCYTGTPFPRESLPRPLVRTALWFTGPNSAGDRPRDLWRHRGPLESCGCSETMPWALLTRWTQILGYGDLRLYFWFS